MFPIFKITYIEGTQRIINGKEDRQTETREKETDSAGDKGRP